MSYSAWDFGGSLATSGALTVRRGIVLPASSRAGSRGELAVDAELVCVQTDLGIPFRSDRWAYDGGDQYFCFQRIYSRRHWQEMPPRWDAVSATRPLRCVLLNRMPADVPAFRNWIENHRDNYTLREVRTYPATHGSKVEPALIYVVCEFVPTSPQPRSKLA